MLRDTSAPPSVRVVGARNLHKRVCRLACGDCALHKRVKPGLELLSPLTLSYPVPPRMKQRDDLHTNHTGANRIPGAAFFGETSSQMVVYFGTLWTPLVYMD